MKIVNRTHWQTRPLARIARRVLTLECANRPERRIKAPRLTLVIGYNRGGPLGNGGCSGHAPIGGWRLTVNVESGRVDPVDFAHVVGHELGHVWGMRHPEMRHVLHYSRGGPSRARYAWAASIAIAKRIVRTRRPTPDAARAHIETMLRRAATRAKRAATIAKKWQRRLRDFDRRQRLAAERRSPNSEPSAASTNGGAS